MTGSNRYQCPTDRELLQWLRETEPGRLQRLWDAADRARQQYVGDEVHVRGLLEISSFCDRSCAYCGLRMENDRLQRYRLTATEIEQAARRAVACGYGTIVMQAGEDPGLDIDRLCRVIAKIKRETSLAVTLSLGERTEDELRRLRRAGADRYLLRFETSNLDLLRAIHPPRDGQRVADRVALLATIRELGYELGSGVMIGIPGQTTQDLAGDLKLFRELELDMIGVGPYIPHPQTPLYDQVPSGDDQVLADELTTYKVIALARLICPLSNIPSTTALATLAGPGGRMLGLQRGANVIMPNVTPARYRQDYEIYPHKAGSRETDDRSAALAGQQIAALGRRWATGRGDSPSVLARRCRRSNTR